MNLRRYIQMKNKTLQMKLKKNNLLVNLFKTANE
jgi:hypothetical protein